MTGLSIGGIAIDCRDEQSLLDFYSTLLDVPVQNNAIIVGSAPSGRGIELWFQAVDNYQPPTWPDQQRGQQVHLDFFTDDRDAMIARAQKLGATTADHQSGQSFTVMIDPQGHPFCICDVKE